MFLPTKVKLLPTYGTRYSSLHHSHNITYFAPPPQINTHPLKTAKERRDLISSDSSFFWKSVSICARTADSARQGR